MSFLLCSFTYQLLPLPDMFEIIIQLNRFAMSMIDV